MSPSKQSPAPKNSRTHRTEDFEMAEGNIAEHVSDASTPRLPPVSDPEDNGAGGAGEATAEQEPAWARHLKMDLLAGLCDVVKEALRTCVRK